MPLREALEIETGDVACFVGAGGKTSATMQLAGELAEQGRRVLVTTTTKIIEPLPDSGRSLVLAGELELARERVRAEFARVPLVILARERIGVGKISLNWVEPNYPVALSPHKLEGVPPEWIAPLARETGADVILVEADGANHRMLKAPNGHEPVLPACATLVVPMADADAIGKPITDEFVHRPALLADLAGIPVGSPISPEVMAIALAHPNGGLKGMPNRARVTPILTVHSPRFDYPNMQKIIRLLLLSPCIRRVVVGYLRARPALVEVFPSC